MRVDRWSWSSAGVPPAMKMKAGETPALQLFRRHFTVRFERKVNSKHRATTGIFADDDLAALGDDEAADDRETETEAAGARGVATLEFLEKPLAHLQRKTRPAIRDGEKHPRARAVDASREKNRRGGGRV